MDYGRRCDDLADTGLAANSLRDPPNARKLTRRLLAAVHYACDQGEFDAALRLLFLTEDLMRKREEFQGASGRRLLEQLVLAYERAWGLRASAAPVAVMPLNPDRFSGLRMQLQQHPDGN